MNILITIFLVVTGIIALLLIIALFLKKEQYVNREIVINAPLQKVFDFLRFLENQDKYNKWAKTDPDRKIETENRFTKPMNVIDNVIMETELLSVNQTKVTLINTGKLKYPLIIIFKWQ